MCTRCPTPPPAWAPGQAEPLHPTFALHLPWGVRGLGQLALPHVLPTAGRAAHGPSAPRTPDFHTDNGPLALFKATRRCSCGRSQTCPVPAGKAATYLSYYLFF